MSEDGICTICNNGDAALIILEHPTCYESLTVWLCRDCKLRLCHHLLSIPANYDVVARWVKGKMGASIGSQSRMKRESG